VVRTILDTERCGGTDRIDVISDVHVKVSRASVNSDSEEVDIENKFCTASFLKKIGKKFKKRGENHGRRHTDSHADGKALSSHSHTQFGWSPGLGSVPVRSYTAQSR
jgi:hypothetical protein